MVMHHHDFKLAAAVRFLSVAALHFGFRSSSMSLLRGCIERLGCLNEQIGHQRPIFAQLDTDGKNADLHTGSAFLEVSAFVETPAWIC